MMHRLASTILALTCASAAQAQETAFTPKQLTVVVAYAPGGAYDIYARLYARHVGSHLPGNPQVIVQNMPGAGGLTGANYIAGVAPHDGTVVGMVSQTAAIGQVLETPGVRYDVRSMNWIGRITSNVQLLHTWRTAKAKDFEDTLKVETVVGGTGPTSSSVVFPRIMNDLLGTKFRVIPGFQGTAATTLAMERGEIDAVVRPWAEIKAKNPAWVKDGTIHPIVQFSLERHPDLKDTPAIVDLGKDEGQRQLLSLFASGSDVGNAIVAPPGLPPTVVAALRKSFEETMKDPALVAEAGKAAMEIDWTSGEKLQALNASIFKIPPEVIERAKPYAGSGG